MQHTNAEHINIVTNIIQNLHTSIHSKKSIEFVLSKSIFLKIFSISFLVYKKPVPPCWDTKSSIFSSSSLSIVCKIWQQISAQQVHQRDYGQLIKTPFHFYDIIKTFSVYSQFLCTVCTVGLCVVRNEWKGCLMIPVWLEFW